MEKDESYSSFAFKQRNNQNHDQSWFQWKR